VSARLPRALVALALALALAVLCPAAQAADPQVVPGAEQLRNALPAPSPVTPEVFRVKSLDEVPPTFAISARQAIRIAERTKAVREVHAKYPNAKPVAFISPLRLAQGTFYHWDIIYFDGDKEVGEVEMGRTGMVFDVSTGADTGWPVVRGYEGVLGRKLNSPYLWLPLCLIFLAPFLDFRRPFRLLHLDLLVLLAFGVSHYFFNLGKPGVSVPLVYPVLLYVIGRSLVAAFRPRRRAGPLVPHMSTRAMVALVVVLLALRAAFSIAGSGTFDISYAGVIGADRIMHGQELYVDNHVHADTYGPLNYLAYVPFELAFPYTGDTSNLPAAKAASLGFDLMTGLSLLLLGMRLRRGQAGRRLGVALMLAWTAYPYTSLILASNTNDALVPLFVVLALVAIASPVRRGVLLAAGTMTKFAPALLAPVFAAGNRRLRPREAAIFSAAFVVTCAVLLLPFIPDGGLRELWNTTLGFQLQRTSPLSLWDRHPDLEWLQTLTKLAAPALALAAAFWPRRRTTAQVAALCAAILAASQVAASYWIYFYAVWLAPLLLIAVFAEHRDLGGSPSGQRDEVLGEAREPVSA
jgi:hypothetical protein